MNIRIFLIVVILVVLTMGGIFAVNRYKYSERSNIKIPILLYHDFMSTIPDNDPNNFNYINTPESFEENMKFIIKSGYTIISMRELNDANIGKAKLPSKPILITFDDGYYSNYEYIYPIIKKYNIRASIFVVTDKVGKEIDGIKYLGWSECLEMQNSELVEIFSHSKRHIFYDKVSIREVRDDVIKSYKIIEEKLGNKKLKVFAYPYGAYTKGTVRALKNSGIDMQIYDIGMNHFKDFNKDYIKRINIPCDMTGREIVDEIEKTE